ncbi:MAG TPA: hypothetical protein VEW46_08670 [Pyrinomonadaceae bacterium]|nr:hypothetical protein [Pyrinomonadaceae bacterium]
MAKASQSQKDQWRAGFISSTKNLVWGTVIIALLIGALFLIYKAKRATRPAEYEGRIIDKWAGYTHSELGSRPYFQLLLETRGGQRITVSIDQDLYQRVKVGTWIKKTKTGVELGQVNPATSRDVAHGSIRCDFESSKSNV